MEVAEGRGEHGEDTKGTKKEKDTKREGKMKEEESNYGFMRDYRAYADRTRMGRKEG